MRKSRVLLTLILIFAVAFISFSGFASNENKEYGGEVIYALEDTIPALDPHKYGGHPPRAVLAPVYSTLYRYSPDREVVEDLASSFEVVDEKRFRIKIRDDVTFHNGGKLTAEDVKYTVSRIQDPAIGAQWQPQLKIINEVEIIDDYTFDLVLEKIIPPGLIKEYFAQTETAILDKDWMENNDPNFEDPSGHNGSGPFIFEKRTYGVGVTLKRNPNYYRKDEDGNSLPYLDEIVFRSYTDIENRMTALKAGDIDLDYFLPWAHAKTIEERPDILVTATPYTFMDLTFNVGREPFDSALVRRAVAHAIDREAVIQTAFNGYGVPVTGGPFSAPAFKNHWAYETETQGSLEYDLDKAEKLLEQAGYPNGFEAKLLTSATDRMHWLTAQVVQAGLKKIGCDVKLQMEDWAKRVETGNQGDYQFAINGTSLHFLDPDSLSQYWYGPTPPNYHRPANWDFPKLDSLLEEARNTVDREKRKELYLEWEKLFVEESPDVVYIQRSSTHANWDYVKNFEWSTGPGGTASSEWLEKAWVSK